MRITAISSDVAPIQPSPIIGPVRPGRDDWRGGENQEGLTSVQEQRASPDFTVTLSREAERMASANREPDEGNPASGEVREQTRNGFAEAVTYNRNAEVVSESAASAQAGTLGVMTGVSGEGGAGVSSAPVQSRPFSMEPGEGGSVSGQPEGGAEARTAERAFMGGPEGGSLGLDGRLESEPGQGDRPPAGDERGRGNGGAAARLTEEERREVEELKKRDREVRAHEQAHLSAGSGVVAGGASYDTVTGPDGKSYAVGGEVPLSIKEGSTPEETLANARKVKASALAPGEPSGQDRMVAAKAAQLEASARQEKALERGYQTGLAGPTLYEQGGADPANLDRLMEKASKAYERVSGAMFPVDSGVALSSI